MEDVKILDKRKLRNDDLILEYKKGRRTRSQVDTFILKMMNLAREDERRAIRDAAG